MGWASLRLPCQRSGVRRDLRPGEGQGNSLRQRATQPHGRPDQHPPRRARLLLRGPLRPPVGGHDSARDGELGGQKYMNKLEGKIALITGGNSGIGLATAKQFVNEGAYVFITGRREPELTAAVKEIGSKVTGVQGDVANLGDLDRLFTQIKRDKGKLDIVFANAGGAKFTPLGKITEEHYDALFNSNVKGL